MDQAKTCRNCGLSKPLGEYYAHPGSPDGLRNDCKTCRKAESRRNYAKNRDKHLETCRKYREENGEQLKAYFRKRHREKYSTDPSYVEARKVRSSLWGKKNRDKTVQYSQNRRARKLAAFGTYTGEEFEWLCINYNYQCLDCGSYDKPLTVDHVIPLSLGGTNTIENIQPLCGRCNSRKGTKIVDYRN